MPSTVPICDCQESLSPFGALSPRELIERPFEMQQTMFPACPRLMEVISRQCVCVCVFFTFILDIKFVGRTSRVTQEEGHTGFLFHLLSAVRALIFLARRIQPFLSLVDREVEFCVLTI